MQSIPTIIHQTWKTEDVPPQWRNLARSWRDLHPGWQYHLWTDEANRALVAEHYPRLLPVYDGYLYAIQRADVARYCILYRYGGVYADLDIECLQPIDPLIEQGGFLAPLEPPSQSATFGLSTLISNAFMASPPGHPFLEAVIEELISRPGHAVTHVDVLGTTGPIMLERVRTRYGGEDVTALPFETLFPLFGDALDAVREGRQGTEGVRAELVANASYGLHYWSNSWVASLAGELVNPRPFEVEGFDFYPNLDSNGNDIVNLGRDVQAAAKACLALGNAIAFNTDGFAKRSLRPRREWNSLGTPGSPEGLYVKKRRSLLQKLLGRT